MNKGPLPYRIISAIGSYLAACRIHVRDYAISRADLPVRGDRNHSPLNDTHLRCREKHLIREKRDEDIWVPSTSAILSDSSGSGHGESRRASETSSEILSEDTNPRIRTQNFIKWNLAALKVKFKKKKKKYTEAEKAKRSRNGAFRVREDKHFVCTRPHCSCPFVLRSWTDRWLRVGYKILL